MNAVTYPLLTRQVELKKRFTQFCSSFPNISSADFPETILVISQYLLLANKLFVHSLGVNKIIS